MMAHNRKIVLVGVSLTKARLNRHSSKVLAEIMVEMERLLASIGYFEHAPFKWIGLILRYGLKNEIKPHDQGIDSADGELALAIELDTHEVVKADKEELKRLFTIATLRALIDAGKKYGRPYGVLQDRLNELTW